MKILYFKHFSVIIAALTIVMLLSLPMLGAQTSTTFSNPSVIPGAQADLHGPRVSGLNFPIFTSDHAAVEALLAGQINIMDIFPSQLSDIQTVLSTNYLNVTSGTGSIQEFIQFNMYSPAVPSYDIHFRQAIAHLVDYGYIQSTVLNGIQGIASPNYLLPSLFGDWSTTDITTYPYDLNAANASLGQDPQLKWNPTAMKPASSNTIACDGSPGVWQWSDGSALTPIFITRTDFPTWMIESEEIWHEAAKIGLCLSLEPKNGYAAVYPIIGKQYNNDWVMYFGGHEWWAPVDPISELFFVFSQNPGWVCVCYNHTHFSNSTLEPILHDMYSTTDMSKAEADSRQADQILSQQIPMLNMWHQSLLIPSLNNYNGVYWGGYVNSPAFSSWQTSTAQYTTLNAHKVDPTTGNTITGGTFVVGLHEAPDDMNIFISPSNYDLDIISQIIEAPMRTAPGNPTDSGLIPWMLTGPPTVTTGVTTTTPHGYKIVNGMTIGLNFMNNITWTDNVRLTANDMNFTLWYMNVNGATYNATTGRCSAPCWMKYVNNVSPEFSYMSPDLTDSVVTSPTSMTVYMNGTGFEDYLGIVTTEYVNGGGIVPEHLWSQVNSTAFNNDIDPTANSVAGASLMTGSGPFIFQKWVRAQYVSLTRNPSYFRTDIRDWALSAQAGSTLPMSVTLMQQGTPIPTSAIVNAYVLQSGMPANVSTTLTAAGSVWNGTLNTASLSPGFYEIVVNGTYEDANMMPHEALQFWGLNIGGAMTTTSVGPSPVAGLPTYAIGAVVLVVLVVIGLVVYVRRRSKRAPKKS